MLYLYKVNKEDFVSDFMLYNYDKVINFMNNNSIFYKANKRDTSKKRIVSICKLFRIMSVALFLHIVFKCSYILLLMIEFLYKKFKKLCIYLIK
jgi:hypothetical protein